jgi:hypothetical protein
VAEESTKPMSMTDRVDQVGSCGGPRLTKGVLMVRRPGQGVLSRVTSLLAVAAVLGLSLAIGGPPSPASAADRWCSDGAVNPPSQVTDLCFVRHSDVNQHYVAEVTGEDDCSQFTHTYFKLRVRIVGSYVAAGDKFAVRQFSIRYLSGAKPWAFFQLHVQDGNNQWLRRPWNWNGGWITGDAAARDVDNTVNLYPPQGYAPVWGANQRINFVIDRTRISPTPYFPYAGYCTGLAVVVQMRPSALP